MLKKRLLKSIIMRHAGDSSFKYTGKRKILLFGHSRFRKHKGNCSSSGSVLFNDH